MPEIRIVSVRQAKLATSSRWKSGPGKGSALGSECCVGEL